MFETYLWTGLGIFLGFEILLFCLHRRRQRRVKVAELNHLLNDSVWHLPHGWSSTPSTPHPILATHYDPTETHPSAPAPVHISSQLRTPGYVLLGVVEKWHHRPSQDDEPLPRYESWSGFPDTELGGTDMDSMDPPPMSPPTPSLAPTGSMERPALVSAEARVDSNPPSLPPAVARRSFPDPISRSPRATHRHSDPGTYSILPP